VSDVSDVSDVGASASAHTSTDGNAEDAIERLLTAFPGATVENIDELASPTAECGCHRREREWRLRGPAVDASYAYLTGKAYREAAERAAENSGSVVAKGPRSGWVCEQAEAEQGHPWTCGRCHPPADGLDVEWRDAPAEAAVERIETP
jgi:hypothetical protein